MDKQNDDRVGLDGGGVFGIGEGYVTKVLWSGIRGYLSRSGLAWAGF